jgi:iron complex outermembrane receptor protein
MIARLCLAALLLGIATPAHAQAPANQQPQPDPTQKPAADDTGPIKVEEQVVVSASRVEQQLVDAPAAVSIVTSETIQSSPATNIGDLLRVVPGMNVTQVSARDVNLTSRGATGTLATSQLALVDGRSVYLDFFGMVMWDLVPTNPDDIKQIEVIRGPASAVWGANALTGVVNIITRSPRELASQGAHDTLTVSFGGFNRNVTGRDEDAGSFFSVNGSHAQVANDRWSFKVSAGYLTQDALPRPTGSLPGGTPYPPFENQGTSQPKLDGRVDYEMASGARLTFAGGAGGTEGIIHTGIGPFDIDNESYLGYFTTRYQKGGRRVAFFVNQLQGDASNLLTVGPGGVPIGLTFDTTTFDIDASEVRALGTRHALSYGGNYRHNGFDISLAPNAEDRNEGGVYVQDEILLSRSFRLVLGGRVDKFSSIDNVAFSPRTTFMYKPSPSQTVRASFNRAFRAPSLINNHLDVTIITPVVLTGFGLFAFPTRGVGNPDLEQETMTAVELGYSGIVRNRATVTAAVYWNTTDDAIAFTPVEAYSPANPPPGWPLLPQFVPPNLLTSRFTYVNLGTVKDKGIELGVDAVINRYLGVFTNYSYQWDPVIEFPAPFTAADWNAPANNRFNAGVNVDTGRFLGNFAVNFTDEAYWQDVLDARFAGTTESFTLLNGSAGVRWAGGRVVTSVKATNLANKEVMQHIFGDVIRRQIVGEVRLAF